MYMINLLLLLCQQMYPKQIILKIYIFSSTIVYIPIFIKVATLKNDNAMGHPDVDWN